MERQATVQVNFKLGDLKSQVQNTVTGLGRGVGEATGLASDRRMKEQAEATKGLSRSMQDLAAVAVTSGLAMTGMVAAASPDAINTLWGSVKLLSGEIGKMFLPAVVETSGYLQSAADYVRNLDDGTRGAVSSFASWTAGISLAGFALQKLSGFALTAWEGLTKAATAAKYLVMGLGPIPTIVIGLTAAAAAFRLFGDSVERAANQFTTLRDVQESGGFGSRRMNRSEYNMAIPEAIRNRIEAAPAGERSGVINDEIRRAQREQQDSPASQAAFAEMKEELRQAEDGWSFGSGIVRNWRRRNAINRVRQRHGMDSVSGDMGEGSEGTGSTWNERDRELYAARYSGVERQTSSNALISGLRSILNFGAPGSGTQISSSFNSRQFSSAGGFYDVIAQKALSQGELDKSLEQLQQEGNTLLGQIATNTRRDPV